MDQDGFMHSNIPQALIMRYASRRFPPERRGAFLHIHDFFK